MRLLFLFYLFQIFLTVKSGSHSFWMFSTFIKGETPFPEYQAIFMLDDIPFAYYDSNDNKVVHRGLNGPERTPDLGYVPHGINYECMRSRASYLRQLLNHTNSFHVLQRILGCQLQENEDIGTLTHKDAFNGAIGDVRYYNPQSDSLYTDQVWPDAVDGIWVGSVHIAFAYYHPLCIETLKTNLEKEKNRVLKKMNPRVRLLQKTLPDPGGAKVTCLATGFYPRHINLTLLRDGQPVSDHQITGGELLPNGDETYQMRKSLEVSAEELQHHHYTCTAEHLSLDNKLDISLDHEWDSVTTSIVPSVLIAAGLLCLAGVGVGAFVLWRRTRTGEIGQGSQTSLQVNTEASEKYTSVSTTDANS
ncbi:major histocompatibility complex class I-related gene protein-like isoform X1 [Alosa sapidissima]|uniref:major histocompatibility complex class I-related gene protein-like isoform X1 n=1 Tax=Alosa sapidissima TaxID=34773 RepID=UPI001C0A53D6|nr:major histocompatibility complex class I-related gene protein-like isoform X1 [Alosa sapidissima]